MTTASALLDLPAFPADRYAPLADRLKAVLGTRNDVVFVQAEAILALEAAATSLGAPGRIAVNIVTSPYGGYFGTWLKRAGASVHTIEAEAGRPVTVDAVKAALDALPRVDLVAMVHAETSSGILNPLADIATLARAKGSLLVVDAVASVGGHPLDVDALGIDLCVIGAQKALAGPAGVSAISVSARAWTAMATHASASPSNLSLLDLKTNWLDRGRGALPGMPSALEFWALEAALDRLEAETLAACVARHQSATRATRAGLHALGMDLWSADETASALVTTFRQPVAGQGEAFIAAARQHGAAIAPAFGAVASTLVRLDHTGQRAQRAAVAANLTGVSRALADLGLPADLEAALAASAAAF